MAKRVLLISYPFPPVGGAGVQRAAKFVKYLPRCGWDASVLTVSNPSVPAVDHTLLADIPQETIVRRGRTLEPSYGVKASVAVEGRDSGGMGGGLKRAAKRFTRRMASLALQPDPQVLWMPGAIKEGKALLDQTRHDAIVATGPPFSTFLIGVRLSRYSGLPLVLDYRDEWDLSNAYLENKRLDALSLAVQGRMQRGVVRRAAALVATTRHSARALEAICRSAGSAAAVRCIYNGYDPEDFAEPAAPRPPAPPGDLYRLIYTGTLWNLTNVQPLVEALFVLASREPSLVRRVELVFAGRRTEAQQQVLNRVRELPCRLTEHAYVEHRDVVGLLKSADGTCVLLSDLPGAERVMPAKLFEYLAARRPILAIAPPGEVTELLAGGYPSAGVFHPRQVEQIAGWLAEQVRGRNGVGRNGDNRLPDWDPSQYGRANQAKQLADLLESVSGRPQRAE